MEGNSGAGGDSSVGGLSTTIKTLPGGIQKKTIVIDNVEGSLEYIREEGRVARFKQAVSLLLVIVIATLVAALAFIFAGIGLVYLGATGSSEIMFFGLSMKSTNVGIVSIAFGAVIIVVTYRSAMKHVMSAID